MLASGVRGPVRPSVSYAARSWSRPFHSTVPALVNPGDKLPDLDLVEGSPGNKVNLSRDLRGKALIIGVPAAFSTFECSISHIFDSITFRRRFCWFGDKPSISSNYYRHSLWCERPPHDARHHVKLALSTLSRLLQRLAFD